MTPGLISTAVAASEPAGGAAIGQVALATGFATITTVALLWLLRAHRNGQTQILERAGAFSERVSGLPAWSGLPAGIGGGALLIALLGMYWDISLHIDQGRDPGPLANPAHYLILVGLYGIFAAGAIAVALPKERPGKAAIKLSPNWYAPIGGLLMATCGAFALIGFPLDDVWHRLFGQDVTLWGPTHLMLFGGAAMTLVGQAVLLQEGMRARRDAGEDTEGTLPLFTVLRRVGLMGGLLIGLSTLQGEFDFGVPQFVMLFQPMLIAAAAGMALVASRLWIGRGGALMAAVMFILVRGIIALIVGPLFGETTPALPLYLGEALCVEAAAFVLLSRPLVFGAAGGLLAGTLGFASEWPWVDAVFKLKWEDALMPEALVVAALAGLAGGLLGALLGLGLRGELPRPTVARTAAVGAFAILALLTANGLATKTPQDIRATVALTDTQGPPNREVRATVHLQPADAGDGAAWVNATAWQGGEKLVVDRLKRVREGVYESTKALPVHGDWKATLRLQNGREVAGVPIYLPEDSAIPAKEVPASPQFTRTFVNDHELLQRERKKDIPSWLWTAALLLVLALFIGFFTALSWGVARVARANPRPSAPPSGGRPATARRPGEVASQT